MSKFIRSVGSRVARVIIGRNCIWLSEVSDIDREGMVRLAAALQEIEKEQKLKRDFRFQRVDSLTGTIEKHAINSGAESAKAKTA